MDCDAEVAMMKPWVRALSTLAKPLLLPLAIGALTVYFNYRLEMNRSSAVAAKELANKSYDTLRDPVTDLQAEVKELGKQVELLKWIVLTDRMPADHPPMVIKEPDPVRESLANRPAPAGAGAEQEPLPASLDEAP